MPKPTPTPYELWKQAGGGTDSYDRARYRELLIEHGGLVPLAPGEQREPLPCGWPDRRVSDDEWPRGVCDDPLCGGDGGACPTCGHDVRQPIAGDSRG